MNGLTTVGTLKRLFLGKTFPLTCLSGGVLLIIASDRFAHAIIVSGALVWVYSLITLTLFFTEKYFPMQGHPTLLAFLSSFFAGIYFLLIWMISPFIALQVFFIIPLIPIFCVSSGLFTPFNKTGLAESVRTSVTEALTYGILIAIFALIREPFGFSSLSVPGGAQGIILLFSFDESQSFLPIRIITSSSGAFLLLGYIAGLYRHYKANHAPEEENDG